MHSSLTHRDTGGVKKEKDATVLLYEPLRMDNRRRDSIDISHVCAIMLIGIRALPGHTHPGTHTYSVFIVHGGHRLPCHKWRLQKMWLDRIETRLNACSLEVSGPLSKDLNHCRQAILIGCYELNDSDPPLCSPDSQPALRNGEIILCVTESSYEDGQPRIGISRPVQTIQVDTGGILDGKFLQGVEHPTMYCTASSSGYLTLFHLQGHDEASIRLVPMSSFGDSNVGLCLSLGWDNYVTKDTIGTVLSRIVSSYSNGSLAIHDIMIHMDESSGEPIQALSEESYRWNAHSLFGSPTEVWTTCFGTNRCHNTYKNIVISGADDCKMKLWDIRTTTRPIQDIQSTEAGVTVVTYHPSLEHVFASGSYDESISIWDMRKIDSKTPLQKLDNVGGGIWRLKWHPCHVSRMLVGAMHGGGRVLNISCLENASQDDDMATSASATQASFTAHQSMTYGADWIYCSDCNVEAAATCSFYDRQVFIWSAQ